MSDNVTNEMILEHVQALQKEAETARTERDEIRDELRAVIDQVSALQNNIGTGTREETALAQKVSSLDN